MHAGVVWSERVLRFLPSFRHTHTPPVGSLPPEWPQSVLILLPSDTLIVLTLVDAFYLIHPKRHPFAALNAVSADYF